MIPPGWGAPLARLKAGEISPEIALTLLLLANSEADPVSRVTALAASDPGLRDLAELAQAQRFRIGSVQGLVASGIDPAEANAPEDRVAATRAHFDRLAGEAPEAAVALYSFGDPDLLAAATREVVEVIAAWTVLDGRHVLDFGCGIGRIAAALAGRVGEVVGLDLSERMIAEAKARTAGLPNLRFEVSGGVDLGEYADGSFDLMLAVDSFPYLVRAGGEVLRTHLAEAARVLRPGGELMVFNWSYRGDLGRDIAEARELGQSAGFRLLRAGEQPFRIWNGAGFHLVRA